MELEAKASTPMKKIWGIRHIRFLIATIQFWNWWRRYGSRLGAFPNALDFDYLQGIRDGKH